MKERDNTYVTSKGETYALFFQLEIGALEITEIH